MRLIDADALKEEVNEKKVVGRFNTLLLIDNAPTVESQQGEWICDYRYLDCKCSICNSYALERGDYPELSVYCPQCGARMKSVRFKDGGTE